MSSPLPHEHTRRLIDIRDHACACSAALAAHARDLMQPGADVDAIARVQLVRAHVDGAVAQLDHALREAGADGS